MRCKPTSHSTSATTRPALDPEAAVALIVPWPWQVRTRTPLSRDSICHPLLQPTRSAVPDPHHQRVPGRCVPSVVWPPQVLVRRGWRLSSWLSHLASMERPGSCRWLTCHSVRPSATTSNLRLSRALEAAKSMSRRLVLLPHGKPERRHTPVGTPAAQHPCLSARCTIIVPSGSAAPSNACFAADNSPTLTKDKARAALFASS